MAREFAPVSTSSDLRPMDLSSPLDSAVNQPDPARKRNGNIIPLNSPSTVAQCGKWAPADLRKTNPVSKATYVPDRAYRVSNESPEERIHRMWARLSRSLEAHSGHSSALYADRFTQSAAARNVSPLDTVNDIMGKFRKGAGKLGIQLEMPEIVLQPATVVPLVGEPGPEGTKRHIIYKYGKSV